MPDATHSVPLTVSSSHETLHRIFQDNPGLFTGTFRRRDRMNAAAILPSRNEPATIVAVTAPSMRPSATRGALGPSISTEAMLATRAELTERGNAALSGLPSWAPPMESSSGVQDRPLRSGRRQLKTQRQPGEHCRPGV